MTWPHPRCPNCGARHAPQHAWKCLACGTQSPWFTKARDRDADRERHITLTHQPSPVGADGLIP